MTLLRTMAAGSLALLILVGCADGGARAWIEASRAQSEAAAAADDVAQARAALEALLALEVPSTVAEDDARVIRQDAHERLGRLWLAQGDGARALAEVQRGLVLGEADDIFTANLWVLRGRVREARGEDSEAAADYHRALLIHEHLLSLALGDER